MLWSVTGELRVEMEAYQNHLDRYIKYSNVSANNCDTFWNQKLWCGTLFLQLNYEKKISSGLQF